MWSPQVTVIVSLWFSIVLCCDLQYRCNHGNYYVSNPEPQTYTYAKADGCETIMSIDKRFVLVRMCTKETVELELHAANGFNMTCNLSCAHSRHRRDKTWSPISMAELYEGGGIEDKACQYSCNNAGLYIDNPRPELYNFLRAYSLPDMIECQWDDPRDDNKILYIYGCPLEGMALIMFSKKSEEENVIERHQNMDIVDCGEFLPFEQPVKSGSDGDIDYDCYPNGTILAVNRRPELWKYGMAMNDQVPCEVIFFNNNKQLVILGCPQVTWTLLVLSKFEDPGDIIIRKNNFFLLDCFTGLS